MVDFNREVKVAVRDVIVSISHEVSFLISVVQVFIIQESALSVVYLEGDHAVKVDDVEKVDSLRPTGIDADVLKNDFLKERILEQEEVLSTLFQKVKRMAMVLFNLSMKVYVSLERLLLKLVLAPLRLFKGEILEKVGVSVVSIVLHVLITKLIETNMENAEEDPIKDSVLHSEAVLVARLLVQVVAAFIAVFIVACIVVLVVVVSAVASVDAVVEQVSDAPV